MKNTELWSILFQAAEEYSRTLDVKTLGFHLSVAADWIAEHPVTGNVEQKALDFFHEGKIDKVVRFNVHAASQYIDLQVASGEKRFVLEVWIHDVKVVRVSTHQYMPIPSGTYTRGIISEYPETEDFSEPTLWPWNSGESPTWDGN